MSLTIHRVRDSVKVDEERIKILVAEYVMQETGRSVDEVVLHLLVDNSVGEKLIKHSTVFLSL